MKVEELNVDEKIGHVKDVLTEDQKKRGVLIHAFQSIQKEYNYLPEDVLKALARKLDIPLAEVYSTATFYKHFYFKPRPRAQTTSGVSVSGILFLLLSMRPARSTRRRQKRRPLPVCRA